MAQQIREIGSTGWTHDEIRSAIPSFLSLYDRRPMKVNTGGMRAPHMFATWYMLRKLQPRTVVESGVWRGQGTWLIEHALPQSDLLCFDIDYSKLKYRSQKAEYYEMDVVESGWERFRERDDILFFFDDHQNAVNRLRWAKNQGIKHLIFEDNYPRGHGDCYSLKKLFMQSDHDAFIGNGIKTSILRRLAKLGIREDPRLIPHNRETFDFVTNNLEIYFEFPPVIKSKSTRWGEPWSDFALPTPKALYDEPDGLEAVFLDEANSYTWICYAKLR